MSNRGLLAFYGPCFAPIRPMALGQMGAIHHPILPRPVRHNLPAQDGQPCYVLKVLQFLSIASAQELTRKTNEMIVLKCRVHENCSVVALEYLVRAPIRSAGIHWLERWMGADERKN